MKKVNILATYEKVSYNYLHDLYMIIAVAYPAIESEGNIGRKAV